MDEKEEAESTGRRKSTEHGGVTDGATWTHTIRLRGRMQVVLVLGVLQYIVDPKYDLQVTKGISEARRKRRVLHLKERRHRCKSSSLIDLRLHGA